MNNWKFHIMVLTGLVIGVVGVFYFSGQLGSKPILPTTGTKSDTPTSGNRIIVVEASWGLNCVESMERYTQRMKEKLSRATPEEYNELKKEIGTIPQQGGVTDLVSNKCNGKEICELRASPDRYGKDKIRNCLQELQVVYRCFTIDIRRTASTGFAEPLTIDCTSIEP